MAAIRYDNPTRADLDAIAVLHRASWCDAYASILPLAALKKRGLPAFRREWAKMLQAETCSVLVARFGSVIHGACAIGACGDPDLAVQSLHSGRGRDAGRIRSLSPHSVS